MSKQYVITIGRQCGSGGHTIGKQAAERLGIPFYDKELVKSVAQRSGLSVETIEREGGIFYNKLPVQCGVKRIFRIQRG